MGGTKSAASLLTCEGAVRARVFAPTPATAGAQAIASFLVELAREVLSQTPENERVVGVGVSAGAPADARTGRVFDAPNLPGWGPNGFPLADTLRNALNGLPVTLENDADATALAEHRFGAGQGTRDMVFMTVGTGIGAGLVLDNRLHRGFAGAGGEVGHIAVVPEGRLCKCGMRGCLEAYASGPSLVRIARENGWAGGETGAAVIAGARSGDKAAQFVVEQAAEMLGRGIASLCMILNPQRIVLGTLAVHAGDLLLPPVWEAVRRLTWPRLHDGLEIVSAGLGDRAQDLAALCAFLHAAPQYEPVAVAGTGQKPV